MPILIQSSYLVSNPSRVAKTAERQRITREFWQDTRFEFIANPHTKPRIEQTCRNAGYAPPRIETPEAILEELSHV